MKIVPPHFQLGMGFCFVLAGEVRRLFCRTCETVFQFVLLALKMFCCLVCPFSLLIA